MDIKPVSSIASLSAHKDYVLRKEVPIPTPAGEKQRFLHKDTHVRIASVIHGIIGRVPKSNIEFPVSLDALAERPSPWAMAESLEHADSHKRHAAIA